MIDVYYWPTPNGHKVTIFLEETGLEYRVLPVDIRSGEQFAPKFLKFSPNNKMPAIIDHDGPGGNPISIFESGAILLYLAEKTGKLMPSEIRARYEVIQWLMFQMASVGPMFGQRGHFMRAAPEKIPYAIERYTNEARQAVRAPLIARRGPGSSCSRAGVARRTRFRLQSCARFRRASGGKKPRPQLRRAVRWDQKPTEIRNALPARLVTAAVPNNGATKILVEPVMVCG